MAGNSKIMHCGILFDMFYYLLILQVPYSFLLESPEPGNPHVVIAELFMPDFADIFADIIPNI